jgi:YfiH family protein
VVVAAAAGHARAAREPAVSAAVPPDWIGPDWDAPRAVRALVTTRAGGLSRGSYASLNLAAHVGDDPRAVAGNRARLRSHLPADPVWLEQVHGATVVDAETAPALTRADGAVARSPQRVCAVLTADCVPVLLAHRGGAAVGIAHAGWRGMVAGIIEATLARMAVAPGEVLAWLGPGIGPRAYEVGRDVYDAFRARDAGLAAAFEPRGEGRYRADLYAAARRLLAAAGVPSVSGGGFCTHADPARFFSYRREQSTGRFASLIWIDR